MRYARRMALLAAALVTLVSAFALQAAASPPNHANRFEATFAETTVSVTNRIPDLGIFQLINTGTGTVEGLGDATMTLSVTQDRTVNPCGAGSWTNAGYPSDRAGRRRPRPPRAGAHLSDRVMDRSERARGRSTASRARASSPVRAAAATTASSSRPVPPPCPGA